MNPASQEKALTSARQAYFTALSFKAAKARREAGLVGRWRKTRCSARANLWLADSCQESSRHAECCYVGRHLGGS